MTTAELTEPARNASSQVQLRGRFLIMDDEQDIREITAGAIREIGGDADCVADGATALRLYREAKEQGRPYELVILDLTIRGGMGGKETNELLHEIDPTVKTIVMSGYSNDLIMADCRKYGFSAMIAKPFAIAGFTRAVYDLLNAPVGAKRESDLPA